MATRKQVEYISSILEEYPLLILDCIEHGFFKKVSNKELSKLNNSQISTIIQWYEKERGDPWNSYYADFDNF